MEIGPMKCFICGEDSINLCLETESFSGASLWICLECILRCLSESEIINKRIQKKLKKHIKEMYDL